MRSSLRKAIYVLLPLGAYMVVNDVTRYLLTFIIQMLVSNSTTNRDFVSNNQAVISGVVSIIAMAVGAIVLLIMMKRDVIELSIWDYVNLNGLSFYRADKIHSTWVSYVVIAIQSVSAAIGLNALLYLIGLVKASESYSPTGSQYQLPLWFGLLIYGFISPAVEELLHRIIIFGRLKRVYPYAVSVIVSALFFGFFHANLVQLIYGSLMGILMCLAVEYVHSIWGSFFLHSLANIVVYTLSSIGVFTSFGTWSVCIACLVIAGLTLAFELIYSHKSAAIYGIPAGVEHVGIFYVDEGYEEYIDEDEGVEDASLTEEQ